VSLLSDIEARRIRDETVREVIARLRKGASDPERIGRRVLAWDYRLRQAATGEKLVKFAQRLEVSPARASIAVSDAHAALSEIVNVNTAPTEKITS
jgi:hypothetical protein